MRNDGVICAVEHPKGSIEDSEIKNCLHNFLSSLDDKQLSPVNKILLLPPDFTRYHSQAGKITQFIVDYFINHQPKLRSDDKKKQVEITILPALGTHAPMTKEQMSVMFGDELVSGEKIFLGDVKVDFLVHNWREDVVTIGHVPAKLVRDATDGLLDVRWPAQLNRKVWEGGHDLVLSIGQVVPHEVMGMANFNKNLFVGCGGVEAINLSHFIGAVHGMERMMGKADNPLRDILNYASEHFLQKKLPLFYILTVVALNDVSNEVEVKGFYIGNDIECYKMACELSLNVNFTMVERPLSKVVCLLDPDEFHSTWLGNKAIYRTRMAIEDGGHLIVLAPGVKQFGEDETVDKLIRKYGYIGTEKIMKLMNESHELQQNLSAVAHLIHGSSEGRFKITYCCKDSKLSREEVEAVGFEYANFEDMWRRYKPETLQEGWNKDEDGNDLYYISNPALGLWASKDRFNLDSNKRDKQENIGSVTQFQTQNASDKSGGVGGWMTKASD